MSVTTATSQKATPNAVRAAVALGSNLGDRQGQLNAALVALQSLRNTTLLARSQWLETEPVGGPPQGQFLNGVALLETELSPHALLRELLRIEAAAGRVRRVHHGPRCLDLDLIFHGDACVNDAQLQLPHPRMHERDFVLRPLAQVAADWIHPVLGCNVLQLLHPRQSTASIG